MATDIWSSATDVCQSRTPCVDRRLLFIVYASPSVAFYGASTWTPVSFYSLANGPPCSLSLLWAVSQFLDCRLVGNNVPRCLLGGRNDNFMSPLFGGVSSINSEVGG